MKKSELKAKGDVFFTKEELEGFFWNKLLRPGSWSRFEEETAQVGIRFMYPTRGGSLTLTVEPAEKRVSDDAHRSVLVFAANFHHEVTAESPSDKVKQTISFIDNWARRMEEYTHFINEDFL